MSEESMPIKPHPDFLKAMEIYGKMTEAEKLASWEQAVQEDLETMRRHMPEGYVIVPVEPTEDMMVEALREMDPLGELVDWDAAKAPNGLNRQLLAEGYRAMIKAAQK